MTSAETSEWQVAGKKSGRRRKVGSFAHSHVPGTLEAYAPPEGPADPVVVARTVARVKEKIECLKTSDFWCKTLQLLLEALQDSPSFSDIRDDSGPCPRLVCLGIGSAESSSSSVATLGQDGRCHGLKSWTKVCQLALAWLLAEELGIPERSWADPQMRAADVDAGHELGFTRQEGLDQLTSKRVLLFMPHCDRPLYETVLSGIAGSDKEVGTPLADVVLLGNSFQVYRERDEMKLVTTGPGAARKMSRIRLGLYISKASQFVREYHNVSYRRLTHLGLAQRDHGAVASIQQSHDALKEDCLLRLMVVDAISSAASEDLPPALTSLIVRYTVKKFSGGREDLLPDDIDDPELLLRALVRKYQFELQSAKSTQFRTETQADNLKKQVDSLQEASEEAQNLAKEATSKLAYSERKVADYRSRIAALGSKWETITGFTNDELERDPNAAAKRFKGELRASQSEIFNHRMTIRRLQKELKVVKEMLNDSEASFTQLYEELVATRLKDQELEDVHNGLENKARVAAVALEEQKKKVVEKSETVRGLLARVHELEANESDVYRKRAAAERKAVVLEREIEQHVQDIKRMESKYHEGVETTLILEKRCKEEEAKLQEERVKVEALTLELQEEKKWSASLKQDLAKTQAEIESITDEKFNLFKENKTLDKKGIMEGKRAREAETEAKKVREMLVDSSSNLVTTTHELGDERKKVSELETRLQETLGTVKEYQELAQTRKNIVEGLEKEVYDLKEQLKDAEVREYALARELKKTEALLSQSVDREKEADAETVRVVSSCGCLEAMQLDPKKTFKVFSGYGVFMNDVWAEAVAEAQPLGLTEQQLLVKLKSRWDQMTGAQKQRYQHRVELSAPCMASVSGGPKTVEPMEVPYTETLPDEEEGSDSDSDYEEVRPVPRLDREDAGMDAAGGAAQLDISQKEFWSLQGEVGGLETSIEDLRARLEDSKEDARAYRKRTFDLEGDLKQVTQRAAESEEREYHLKVECKSLKQKLVKEEDVVADLTKKVEVMNAQIIQSRAMYYEVKEKEAALHEEIEKFKEKHQDAVERGDVLEKSLAHVEGEAADYKGQFGVLREEIHEKKQELRVSKKDLAMTATDLESLKESLESMAADLSKSKKKESEAVLRVDYLEKEVADVKEQLKVKTKVAAKFEKAVEELNVKLEDAMFEVTEERRGAKVVVDKLAQKDAALKKIEHEAFFSKESVWRVCDDVKLFQEKEIQLKEESKALEGPFSQNES
eukprot:symbB.v1.2.035513.t1/scaffold4801.1/size34592/3